MASADYASQVQWNAPTYGPKQPKQTFVLLFDGTGNKFSGTDADSCILKILRLLDRNDSSQKHYYQPGIGTYVQSSSYNHTSTVTRAYSWIKKQRDQAIGSSFAEHVMGGYKFLMRFYRQGDDIFLFGFSRGAYTARFLAEMLDYIGLLEPGNEELARFAWKAFARWQRRLDGTDEEKEEKRKMFHFLKAFRDTFARPVRRLRFLGLFDTVNSVPHFETAFLQRSKFPYTAKSSALVIRHAVSINERRAKFRQDLVSGSRKAGDVGTKQDGQNGGSGAPAAKRPESKSKTSMSRGRWSKRGNKTSNLKVPNGTFSEISKNKKSAQPEQPPQESSRYRRPSRAAQGGRSKSPAMTRGRSLSPQPALGNIAETMSQNDDQSVNSNVSQVRDIEDDDDADEAKPQDIMEVWFPGEHADIGGGWDVGDDEVPSSHVPLCWMVREASRAGLHFDPEKLEEMRCGWDVGYDDDEGSDEDDSPGPRPRNPTIPEVQITSTGDPEVVKDPPRARDSHEGPRGERVARNPERDARKKRFHDHLHRATTEGVVHDSLTFGKGLSTGSTMAWKFMEWLPFRRMDLQDDGGWKPINWPLPRGEVRDIPETAWIHVSAIRRMEHDPSYRPGNLIVGGGGRGMLVAPKDKGIGEWRAIHEKGDPVGECYVRVRMKENGDMVVGGTLENGAGKECNTEEKVG